MKKDYNTLYAMHRSRISKCNNIISRSAKRMSALVNLIGVCEYGEPGKIIKIKHANAIRHVTISHFEQSQWSDIPLCIVEADLNGIKTTLHLCSNKDIVR